jgi:hypothetical protein
MEIYLPIAQLSVNWVLVLGLGCAVGFLSGLLGVSGGFITTPLLLFYGIPPGVAVATQASPIAASSFVGALGKGERGSIDYKMGFVLLVGGLMGSAIGVQIFQYLQRLGQIDIVVELSYVILLGSVGGLMLKESVGSYRAKRAGTVLPPPHIEPHIWMQKLPFKTRFRRSGLYISAIPVLVLGLLVGVMTAILGTGGAFLLIPAKIYILRMQTSLAMGTSQFQMFIVACITTLMHAVTDQTVDLVLALILVCGGVVGAQFGTRLATKLQGEQLRVVFAILILVIAIQLVFQLIAPPSDPYTVIVGR